MRHSFAYTGEVGPVGTVDCLQLNEFGAGPITEEIHNGYCTKPLVWLECISCPLQLTSSGFSREPPSVRRKVFVYQMHTGISTSAHAGATVSSGWLQLTSSWVGQSPPTCAAYISSHSEIRVTGCHCALISIGCLMPALWPLTQDRSKL